MKPEFHKLTRRLALSGSVLVFTSLLAACAGPPVQVNLYALRAEPPAPMTAAVRSDAEAPVVQLLAVSLPESLERRALLVSQGGSGVQALDDHRWAEPLRDAVPRLLRQDLALWLGVPQVWTAPVPPGVLVQRQLRVEVLQLQADTTRRQVQLQARWTVSEPGGAVQPQVGLETLSAAIAGDGVEAIVAAHRLVLWRLSEALAAALRSR